MLYNVQIIYSTSASKKMDSTIIGWFIAWLPGLTLPKIRYYVWPKIGFFIFIFMDGIEKFEVVAN